LNGAVTALRYTSGNLSSILQYSEKDSPHENAGCPVHTLLDNSMEKSKVKTTFTLRGYKISLYIAEEMTMSKKSLPKR
jgi:hypothetical protein